MKRTGKCPKCGSVDVCDDAMVKTGVGDVYVASWRQGFWGYKGGGATPISA